MVLEHYIHSYHNINRKLNYLDEENLMLGVVPNENYRDMEHKSVEIVKANKTRNLVLLLSYLSNKCHSQDHIPYHLLAVARAHRARQGDCPSVVHHYYCCTYYRL